jgi:hypothetical protein
MLVISLVASAKVCRMASVTDESFSVGVIRTAALSEYIETLKVSHVELNLLRKIKSCVFLNNI